MVEGDLQRGPEEVPTKSTDSQVVEKKPEQQKTLDHLGGKAVSRFAVISPEELQAQQDAEHKFWYTQPVPKIGDVVADVGPLDAIKTVEQVRQDPYPLPDGFSWEVCDLTNDKTIEDVYQLLTHHYVEDDDALFRFDYSKDFLRWALMPPDYIPDWIIGVRLRGQLMGFITGIPLDMFVYDRVMRLAEVNFLCVHKSLRQRRLAPMLIREVTRRINLKNIWQAVYTAGILLPKPVTKCQYYHRSINVKKLVETSFTCLPPRLNLTMTERLYKIPSEFTVTGIRVVAEDDIPAIRDMIKQSFKDNERKLYPDLDVEGWKHSLMPRKDVVFSWVKENEGKLTDFFSFYNLPSTVIQQKCNHKEIKAAFTYYYANNSMTVEEIMQQMLIAAKINGFDVLNSLDLADNGEAFTALKFGVGDGYLRYYLYNWKMPECRSRDIGLVLV